MFGLRRFSRPTRSFVSVLLIAGLLASPISFLSGSFAANASLNPSHVGSAATNSGETCPAYTDSSAFPGRTSGQLDAWHFVLPGTDTYFQKISGNPAFNVSFSRGAGADSSRTGPVTSVVVIRDSFPKHLYVYTDAKDDARLVSATADVEGPQTWFNLSHTCAGDPGQPPGCTLSSVVLTKSTESNPNYQVTRSNSISPYLINYTGRLEAENWTVTTNNSGLSAIANDNLTGGVITLSGSIVGSGTVSVTLTATPPSGSNCSPATISFNFVPALCVVEYENAQYANLGSGEVNRAFTASRTAITNPSGGTISNYFIYRNEIVWNGVPIENSGSLITSPYSIGSTGLTLTVDSLGFSISGTPVLAGSLSFSVEAVSTNCGSSSQTFYANFTSVACLASDIPSLPSKSWTGLEVGREFNDSIVADNPLTVQSYVVESSAGKELPPGIRFIVDTNGINLLGTFTQVGQYGFTVVANAKSNNCAGDRQAYVLDVAIAPPDTDCKISPKPTLPTRTWNPFRIGSTFPQDEIKASGSSEALADISYYEVNVSGQSTELPPGLLFASGKSNVKISGRFTEVGTYSFTITMHLTSPNCEPQTKSYAMSVIPLEVVPTPSTSTPTPSPTPTALPSTSPTPQATQTPEDEPTEKPTPAPTVTIFVTLAPTSTPAPIVVPTPVPTPSQTTRIVAEVPTAARSKSVVSVKCGEAVEINIKELTKDGSTFDISQLPKTGKILRPNPDLIIYLPDKEKCELGGNDTFFYTITDKNGNVKTVEKVVSQVIEGDMPQWIRTGYVEEGSIPSFWKFGAIFFLASIALIRFSRKKIRIERSSN